jgi:hypothetical protein
MNKKNDKQREKEERFQKAANNLREIQEKIAPFVRERKAFTTAIDNELWDLSTQLRFKERSRQSRTTQHQADGARSAPRVSGAIYGEICRAKE